MRKLLPLALLAMTGCSGSQYLGTIGDTKFFAVHDSRIDGPNFNALVSEQCGRAKVEQIFSGPGIATSIAPALVTAGGSIGAAAVLRPETIDSHNHTAINASTTSAGGAGGTGGSANASSKNNADNSTATNNNVIKVNSDNSTSTVENNSTTNVGR